MSVLSWLLGCGPVVLTANKFAHGRAVLSWTPESSFKRSAATGKWAEVLQSSSEAARLESIRSSIYSMADWATKTSSSRLPEVAQDAVLVKSAPVPEGTPVVRGYDFNQGRDLDGIMAAAMTTGFQVCNYAEAADPFCCRTDCSCSSGHHCRRCGGEDAVRTYMVHMMPCRRRCVVWMYCNAA